MDIKNQLKIGSLEFKITTDKLYIDAIDGSETYALRSINGISVKDDIDGFKQLTNVKKGVKTNAYIFCVAGAVILISFTAIGIPIWGLILGGVMLAFGLWIINGVKEAKLESIVRITMNSGDKAFRFLKDDANSGEVADFVATLESTLTAFHKD